MGPVSAKTPFYSMTVSRSPEAEFPKNAADFMHAIEELFRYRHPFFVVERDDTDSTVRIQWIDRSGKHRQSWVTAQAIQELTRDWVWN